MKTLALAASVSLLAVTAAAAQDFGAAAQRDVDALHQEIRDNHPALVTGGDEAGFAQRLAAGYATARDEASRVRDAQAYAFTLRRFARSMEDTNISFDPNWQTPPLWDAQRWTQFTTGWRNGAYVVTWVDPAAGRNAPPVGATLISCGEQSAEEFARRRLDGWEGDLDQPGDREQTAPYLFWDRGNPFVGGLPTSCRFAPNGRGRGRDYTLAGAFATEPSLRAAWASTVYTPQTALSVETMAGGHWIHVHDLSQGNASQAFLAQIDAQLAAIQGGNVVIDLRGARSGSAALGYSLANRLWGVDYRVSQQRISGQIVYRVSQDNRQFFADTLGRMQGDPVFAANYPGAVRQMQDLLAQFDAAAASGQRTFTQQITPPIPAIEAAAVEGEASAAAQAAAPTNAMRGNIVVLVDGGCRNACLDVVDMLATLPNVRIAGTPTGADSIHFEQTRVALPSGHGYLNYGHKTWVGRTRASNVGFVPTGSLAYTGSPTDEGAVRAWVASLFGG
ncbi:MAG TPA: hypothetical protein PLE81_00930 [Brevundimonas sp.]|uniref:hypothetical protein n=1 Tax=Brevundimonas sp. TaxID=1871086 RepID=UPI002C06FAF7|nr:hypothetical protein [Brevundimonas sp.]HRH19182.1 hypothetical protein [Brevundimonas sp.]